MVTIYIICIAWYLNLWLKCDTVAPSHYNNSVLTVSVEKKIYKDDKSLRNLLFLTFNVKQLFSKKITKYSIVMLKMVKGLYHFNITIEEFVSMTPF